MTARLSLAVKNKEKKPMMKKKRNKMMKGKHEKKK